MGEDGQADPASPDPALVGRIAERLAALGAVIDLHATRTVRVVAVTKRFGPEVVAAAMAAGIADIGENYAQELAAKAPLVDALAAGSPRWHFVGHLQRNKVRTIADVVSLWQTVDTVRLGQEIAKRSPGSSVLVQVNSSGAASQSGCRPFDVPELVESLRELELDVQGLMTIGAVGDAELSARLFGQTRQLADDLELEHCSMGMSADLVEALRAGSTIVRVGTALFGPRPG